MKDKFFGSKLNSILLLILIILMVGAIYLMLQDKEKYFPGTSKLTDAEKWARGENEAYDKYKKKTLDRISGSNPIDYVSFSILPDSKVEGVVSYRGSVRGGYFFEGNILINILDSNNKVLLKGNAKATSDWMTDKPVDFEGSIDFTDLPKGDAYIEIHNDNASGLPENDKNILIPIIIK